MGRFVEGADRSQLTLLRECLEDWVGEDNAVHVIHVFVEALDLHGMGFERVIAKETGRPSYHPAVLLMRYIYGYLNRVQSINDIAHRSGCPLDGHWRTRIGRCRLQCPGSPVDTEHHLIIAHDVINVGNDRGQLARMSKQAKETLEADKLEAVADRGYFDGQEILACEQAGVAVTLPKPMTSGAKAEGRFGKQDFAYLPEEDVYRCPAGGQLLPYHYTNLEHGMTLRRYWSTAACQGCAIKSQCTPSKERRITRWEHEHVVEEVQRRLDANPDAMRTRRETVEHPFGTIKARMGATHFLMKRLGNVATEMALHVLAYNLTRVMNIVGKQSLIAAIRAT
jgi:hypothetical protein